MKVIINNTETQYCIVYKKIVHTGQFHLRRLGISSDNAKIIKHLCEIKPLNKICPWDSPPRTVDSYPPIQEIPAFMEPKSSSCSQKHTRKSCIETAESSSKLHRILFSDPYSCFIHLCLGVPWTLFN